MKFFNEFSNWSNSFVPSRSFGFADSSDRTIFRRKIKRRQQRTNTSDLTMANEFWYCQAIKSRRKIQLIAFNYILLTHRQLQNALKTDADAKCAAWRSPHTRTLHANRLSLQLICSFHFCRAQNENSFSVDGRKQLTKWISSSIVWMNRNFRWFFPCFCSF